MSTSLLYDFALVPVAVFLLLWLSYEYYETKTKVPVFPTMPGVSAKIIDILRHESMPPDGRYTLLDAGSGSGQLTWRIARALPHIQVVGIEWSYVPWLRSVARQRLWGPKNLRYVRGNFWTFDTSPFQAVLTYLPGKIMEEVGAKLRRELKPGALVIANTFHLRADWQPVEDMTLYAPFRTKVFIYRQT